MRYCDSIAMCYSKSLRFFYRWRPCQPCCVTWDASGDIPCPHKVLHQKVRLLSTFCNNICSVWWLGLAHGQALLEGHHWGWRMRVLVMTPAKLVSIPRPCPCSSLVCPPASMSHCLVLVLAPDHLVSVPAHVLSSAAGKLFQEVVVNYFQSPNPVSFVARRHRNAGMFDTEYHCWK